MSAEEGRATASPDVKQGEDKSVPTERWFRNKELLNNVVMEWNNMRRRMSLILDAADKTQPDDSPLSSPPDPDPAPILPTIDLNDYNTSSSHFFAAIRAQRFIQGASERKVDPSLALTSLMEPDMTVNALWPLVRICLPILKSYGLPSEQLLAYLWSLPPSSSSVWVKDDRFDPTIYLGEFFGTCRHIFSSSSVLCQRPGEEP